MDKFSGALTVAAVDQLEPTVGSEPTKTKVIDITRMDHPPELLQLLPTTLKLVGKSYWALFNFGIKAQPGNSGSVLAGFLRRLRNAHSLQFVGVVICKMGCAGLLSLGGVWRLSHTNSKCLATQIARKK